MAKGTTNNVVEINGRLYDATTGIPAATPITKDPSKPKVIDGFLRSRSKKPKTAHNANRQANKAQAHHTRTKRAQTLRRGVLSKPTDIKQAVSTKLQPKKISTPHERVKRAETTKQSQAIGKFTAPTLAKAKAEQQSAPPTAPPSPATSIKQHPKPNLLAVADKKSRNWLVRRPKLISTSAAAIALLLVAGYVTYLNIPNIALRVAAREAGFEANMPGYRPNGYAFAGPISYEQGRITVRFDSKTNDESFQLTQRQTNWDSQSLLDNHVTTVSELHQTYQERGLTIYVYNGSEATWVNGGIWYSIEGDSRLNAEQLIRIASSL